MFYDCYNLTNLNISSFHREYYINKYKIFDNCNNLPYIIKKKIYKEKVYHFDHYDDDR